MIKTVPISKHGDPVVGHLTDEQAWEQSIQLDRQPPSHHEDMQHVDFDNIIECEIHGITEEEAWEREKAIERDAAEFRAWKSNNDNKGINVASQE